MFEAGVGGCNDAGSVRGPENGGRGAGDRRTHVTMRFFNWYSFQSGDM